jgi:hypothetical protein
MSANVDVLRGSAPSAPMEVVNASPTESVNQKRWNPEDFAREQIRGLVRRVFLSPTPAKHVVFSAVELQLDVAGLCFQIAQSLALQTLSEVAFVEQQWNSEDDSRVIRTHLHSVRSIKTEAMRVSANLWRIPKDGLSGCCGGSGNGRDWPACLAVIRGEFEYAVIHGPAAAASSDATALGLMTDGIILVVGAQSTKRAAAKTIKLALEGARVKILGTVLSDRKFPMPEGIYRRL